MCFFRLAIAVLMTVMELAESGGETIARRASCSRMDCSYILTALVRFCLLSALELQSRPGCRLVVMTICSRWASSSGSDGPGFGNCQGSSDDWP